jgi:hypothetical protein
MTFSRLRPSLLTIAWLIAGVPAVAYAQISSPDANPADPPESSATVRLRANKVRSKAEQDRHRMRPTVEDPSESTALDVHKLFGPHANLKNHQASVFDPNTECSATLVGPSVTLTAAHCTEGDNHIYFTLGGNDYSAYCRIFSGRDTARGTGDWALCRVEEDGGVQNIPLFETLNQDPSMIRTDAHVLLTGFGFSRRTIAAGTFSVGAATIIETPNDKSDEIITSGATTTQGDSGSSVFMLTTSSNRRVVGVNSNRTDTTVKTSSASSISTPRAITFIKAWMKDHPALTVCGYTAGASNCQP